MRLFRVTSKAKQFLVSEEAIKTSGPTVFVDKLNRVPIFPCNALRAGKSSLEQLSRAAELYVNVTVAHTGSAASIIGTIDSLDCILSILHCRKFNIAVHGLASGPFHDNMNRASVSRWEQGRTASKERGYLHAGHSVRDLSIIIISSGILNK